MVDADHSADFELRRLQHRPADPEALRREVIRLMREQQMTIRDVGKLFGLSDVELLRLVNENP